MKSKLYYKILAIGIIVLFIGVSVSSANNLNTIVDDEAIDNIKIISSNGGKEIISFVSGSSTDISYMTVLGLIHRNVEIRGGGEWGLTVDIKGFKYSNSGEIIFYKTYGVTHLKIDYFIGIVMRITTQSCTIWGLAIGDIEYY